MNAVTLETLRADYEAFIAEKERVNLDPNSSRGRKLDVMIRGYWPYNLYTIAEQHGVQAAMLFKLSDGAIDPRGDA